MFKRFTPAAVAVMAGTALAAASPAGAHPRHHHARSSDHAHHGYCNHGNYGHPSNNGNDHNHGDQGGGTQTQSCSYGTYSAWDEQWLKTSLEGDLFEIAGGKLAQSHSTNTTVKALGEKLIADHSKSFEEGAELAKKLGIEVPDEPTPSQQWELQAISYQNGSTFDKAYTSLEVADHHQDITEAKDEVAKGCNPLLRHEAAEELPMLEEHLKLSEQALASS